MYLKGGHTCLWDFQVTLTWGGGSLLKIQYNTKQITDPNYPFMKNYPFQTGNITRLKWSGDSSFQVCDAVPLYYFKEL